MSVDLAKVPHVKLQAVAQHLIRLIQDSPDVRYYVGGPLTQMRELLVDVIKAGGHEGDPLELLAPAPHHADEQAHVVRLRDRVDELEQRIAEVGEALTYGRIDMAKELANA